jgi:hypothetical protein
MLKMDLMRDLNFKIPTSVIDAGVAKVLEFDVG